MRTATSSCLRSTCLLVILLGFFPAAAQTSAFGPHTWDRPLDPATLEKRINEQLDLTQKAVQQLIAVKAARTIENTLAPYDDAVQHIGTAFYQSLLMQNVSPDAAIRDRAQGIVQKVSAAGTELALNQAVYKALAALDVSKADPATKYYVQRTLLEFRLAGASLNRPLRRTLTQVEDMTHLSPRPRPSAAQPLQRRQLEPTVQLLPGFERWFSGVIASSVRLPRPEHPWVSWPFRIASRNGLFNRLLRRGAACEK